MMYPERKQHILILKTPATLNQTPERATDGSPFEIKVVKRLYLCSRELRYLRPIRNLHSLIDGFISSSELGLRFPLRTRRSRIEILLAVGINNDGMFNTRRGANSKLPESLAEIFVLFAVGVAGLVRALVLVYMPISVYLECCVHRNIQNDALFNSCHASWLLPRRVCCRCPFALLVLRTLSLFSFWSQIRSLSSF
jgi:hypothetical protein